MKPPEDRCVDFLNAIAEVCAQHHVIMNVDDGAGDFVEFWEHADDPTGFGFISSAVDVADCIQRRFDETHGLDPAN